MTLYQIYDLANYIAGKFPSGGSIPPSRLNLMLPQIQDEFYQAGMKEVIAASVNDMLLDKVLSTTPLRPFKKSDTLDGSTSNGGIYDLPDDYNRYITAKTNYKRELITTGGVTAAQLVADTRKISIINEDLYARKQGDIFTRADEYPFAKITATQLSMVPWGLGDITLEYFRPPTIPVFDYCQDATNPNRIIYMPVGSYLVYDSVTPKWDLYIDTGSVSSLLATNVTKPGALTTSPAYTSLTVELEWEDMYMYKFVYMLLSKIGINLGENEIAKYALEMEQK